MKFINYTNDGTILRRRWAIIELHLQPQPQPACRLPLAMVIVPEEMVFGRPCERSYWCWVVNDTHCDTLLHAPCWIAYLDTDV